MPQQAAIPQPLPQIEPCLTQQPQPDNPASPMQPSRDDDEPPPPDVLVRSGLPGHTAERRMGMTAWDSVSKGIPRPRTNGQLYLPDGKVASLREAEANFPHLPFVSPVAASVRARKLLASSPAGAWTDEMRVQVRDSFEGEGAGIHCAVCIPEVFAHNELKKDPRYQVGSHPQKHVTAHHT